ncbi:MAG: DUF4349 domain-containing protein [Candidatus Bathyarchaeia archaeon]
MSRKNLIILSAFIIILLAASFTVGVYYSPLREVKYPATSTERTYELTPNAPGEETLPEPSADRGATPLGRMVIYTATISLETEDISDVLSRIRALAEGYGGYVAGSSRSTYAGRNFAEIIIRVPKDKFHIALQNIEQYGKVLDEQTSSEDVTSLYIDMKARLDNLKRQEERLRDILNMAKTVEEVLNVERELERVRGEVESLQGQLNYLESSVTMSVITVRLTEPPPAFTPPGMDWGETFEIAIRGFFAVLRGLIIVAMSLLPLALIAGAAYYAYKRMKKRA